MSARSNAVGSVHSPTVRYAGALHHEPMRDDQVRQVAAALDATPELLPFLPELLADLWELGSSPAVAMQWFRELDLARESTRVLDLGCGKGAVAVTLARELGLRVRGVDLFEPFLSEARARAAEWGVTRLCEFDNVDVRDAVRTETGYDVVVYASVGTVLGRLDHCVAALRRTIVTGGYILIDHGYLVSRELHEPGYERDGDREQSLAWLQSHGDELLRERVWAPEETRALDRRYLALIRRRAEVLATIHPDRADLILGYVDRQEQAAERWERIALGATWLLQKR